MTTLSRTEDLQHDSRTSNMFVVPSILDSTMSTEYRWATDSVAGGNDRLQRLASPFFDHGELSRLTEEDSAVQNDETSRVKHLAELLDEFNQTHPTAPNKPAAATVVQDPNSGSDLTTSTGFTSTAESSLPVRPEMQTAGSPGAKGPTSKVNEAAMTREEAEFSRSSVASSPASFDSRSYGDSDYNTETIRLNNPANPDRTSKTQSKSQEQARKPSEVITDPAANFTPMRSKSAGAAENQSPSSRPHQTLANGDTTFLLKQLRQLTVECENRDNLISEMQTKEKEFERKERQWETQQREFKKQQQDLLRQQEMQFQRMLAQIESRSRAQTAAADAETKDLTADLPLAQSSGVKDRVTLESVADSDLESVAEEVSFGYAFDQSRTGIYEPFERDRAAAAAAVPPPVAVEDTVVVHPIPKRPAQVQKPQPVKPGPSSSPAAARTEEELRLLESLSASLRHSLSLEQNLEDARSEIGRLQGLVENLLKQKQNADLQARVSPLLQPVSSTPPFDKEHVTFHKISPSISPVKAAVPPPSFSGNNATNGDSSAPPLSEKTGELEKLVAEYGREIAKLKGRASVMGPADMPDARSYTAFKSDKLYYRLQMDKVDELGVSELGNIVKNILLQLNIPFSELQTCIMSLPVHFENEDRYMHFANDVHRALYYGSQIDPDGTLPLGEGSLHEMECLGEMLARIEKLARAAERREKKRRAAAGRQ
ncbi:hypothetical protein BZA70DRAFT_275279 [Myxozyma melibiosi]|uniref:Uncharacterized protein n=1 Tax=Myxozyma melibiosi TaxID=54550 RepID=A0ABR1FCL1_9ASCO